MHADTPTCAALCCRIAAYVRQPIVSPVLHLMTNFSSWAHLCIQEHPSLVGQPFERLPLLFADATVAGIWIAAPDRGMRAKLGERLQQLRAAEVKIGFDPARNDADFDALRRLAAAK